MTGVRALYLLVLVPAVASAQPGFESGFDPIGSDGWPIAILDVFERRNAVTNAARKPACQMLIRVVQLLVGLIKSPAPGTGTGTGTGTGAGH